MGKWQKYEIDLFYPTPELLSSIAHCPSYHMKCAYDFSCFNCLYQVVSMNSRDVYLRILAMAALSDTVKSLVTKPQTNTAKCEFRTWFLWCTEYSL